MRKRGGGGGRREEEQLEHEKRIKQKIHVEGVGEIALQCNKEKIKPEKNRRLGVLRTSL